MNRFIDIFYSAASATYPYITFVIDDHGIITTSQVHYQIGTVADWCKHHNLPVRAYDRQVRASLRDRGIFAQPYALQEQVVRS